MVAKDALSGIVGAAAVQDDPAVLEAYSRDISFAAPMRPDYVVKAATGEEIRKVVELCRKTGTPLVPVSSGAPHFRGDTVPSVGGAVVLDLSGMKKIIRVDRLNRVAMFEPGVTFGELIPACTREKIRLNMPLLPRATKSVTASLLEREPVVMPIYHWDLPDPLNCVEITFGTGDNFRTGAAAGPGSIEEQWSAGGAQVTAAGPSSVSWYRLIGGSQGTMGVVAWSSARCELLPSLEEPYFAGSGNLASLMEMVHWLIRLRIPNECFILNATSLAAMMAAADPDEFAQVRDGLPPWVLFYNLAGYEYFPEERVRVHREDIGGLAQRAGVEPARSAGGISAFEFLRHAQGPAPEPYWKVREKGACQDILVISSFQNVGKLIDVMYRAADEAGYPVPELGVYVQPLVQGCNYHVEFNLFYDPEDKQQTAAVKKLAARVVDPLIAAGGFFSRPYGEAARAILNRDAATVQTLKKVKAIFDPVNIMNPGKLCF